MKDWLVERLVVDCELGVSRRREGETMSVGWVKEKERQKDLGKKKGDE